MTRARINRFVIALAGGLIAGTAILAASAAAATRAAPIAAKCKAEVAAAEAAVSFTFNGPAFDATKVKGKRVFYLAQQLGQQFTVNVTGGFKEAMDAAGVKVTFADAKGDPAQAARLIQQAIGQKFDAINIQSTPTNLIEAPIQAAKKAGIPVIQEFEHDPSLPPAKNRADGVFGQVAFSFSKAGRLQACAAIALTEGKVNGVIYWDPDVGVGKPQVEALKSTFKQCSGCKVKVRDILLSQWQTRLPSLSATDVSNPDVNFLLPLYDPMDTYIVPSVQAANAQKRVRLAAINATPDQMQLLAKGEVVAADVGQPLRWVGWGIADMTLRALTGQKPVADEQIPERLFTARNVGQVNLKAKQETWFGPVDFRAKYKKLWGLG